MLRGATRHFGRVGLLIPLFLIFIIAADSAYACPGNKTKAGYRIRTTNTRTVSHMAPIVISYGGPARCVNNVYGTRQAKYIAVRGNGKKFVAVRNGNGFNKVRRTRYIALRDANFDDAPRYVAVRRNPVYVDDDGTRYIAVRKQAPRIRYVAVRSIDADDDAPRYVAVRRAPAVRYMAVNDDGFYNEGRTKYVAVRNIRNACACDVSLRSGLDEVETPSKRHLVIKTDDLAGTQEVVFDSRGSDNTLALDTGSTDNVAVLQDASYDDAPVLQTSDADTEMLSDNGDKYVDSDATYSDANYVTAAGDMKSYAPVVYDDDVDDQALLDGDGVTYVAAGNIENACLRPVTSPETVSYIPAEYVDDDSVMEGEATHIATEVAAPEIEYVPVVENNSLDAETTYVAAGNIDDDCLRTCSDVDADTVSYVPVEDVEDINAETVSYVPVNDMNNVEKISIVPVESVDNVDAEPVYVAGDSSVLVEENNDDLVADMSNTQQIAGQFGYRDGFEDGQDAVLERDAYHPENSGDYQKATNGYEDTFGDKDVYKGGYRNSYLEGYRAGFNSVASSA